MAIGSISCDTSASISAYDSQEVQRRQPPEQNVGSRPNSRTSTADTVELSQQSLQLARQPRVDEAENSGQANKSNEEAQQPRGAAANAIAAYQQTALG